MRLRFRLSHRRRALCVGLVMFCLFFQQIAMAAYVCTLPSQPVAMSMAGPCEDMAMAAPHHAPAQGTDPRCAEHCADHTSATPDARVPTLPPLLLPADWPALTETLMDRPDRAALPDPSLMRPDPPPPLRYCSLLI